MTRRSRCTYPPRSATTRGRQFKSSITNTAAAQGGSAEISYRRAYPATINTAHEAERASLCASSVAGVDRVVRDGKPLLAGEDFAFFLERAPGAFVLFGQASGTKGSTPVHNPGYDFNDDLLPLGATYFAELVEQELGAGRK